MQIWWVDKSCLKEHNWIGGERGGSSGGTIRQREQLPDQVLCNPVYCTTSTPPNPPPPAAASPSQQILKSSPTTLLPCLHLTQFLASRQTHRVAEANWQWHDLSGFSQTIDKTSGASVPPILPISFCGQNRQLDNNVAVTGLWHSKTACNEDQEYACIGLRPLPIHWLFSQPLDRTWTLTFPIMTHLISYVAWFWWSEEGILIKIIPQHPIVVVVHPRRSRDFLSEILRLDRIYSAIHPDFKPV